jgi:hypothetical protein
MGHPRNQSSINIEVMGFMMNFDHVVSRRVQKIQSVLSKKAEEYAADNDRYHNFNVAGRILDVSPERALIGMWMKHVVSVLDLVDWIEDAPAKLTAELIDEKVGDTINYLLLLEGLLYKRINEKTGSKK